MCPSSGATDRVGPGVRDRRIKLATLASRCRCSLRWQIAASTDVPRSISGWRSYASEPLKADRDVVLAAVQQNGWALRYAADELRANKDVVVAAVSQSGWALEDAAAPLKADRDVVMAAIRGSKWALRFAAAELRSDKEVLGALRTKPRLTATLAA